jgi:hypothetical protein
MSLFNAAPLKLEGSLMPIETCAEYSSAVAAKYTRTVCNFSAFGAAPSPSSSDESSSRSQVLWAR